MSKKGGSTKVPAVNTSQLIRENEAVNRIGVQTPFGSQQYVTGPNGQRILQTSLSPEMQQMMNHQMGRAQQQATPYQLPNGQADLLANVMSRVRGRYQVPPQDTGQGGGP